jgi:MraZ protein
MAFRGHYEHSLDSKDRITIPARFRADLSKGVVLFAGLDPCVEVWAAAEYESFHERFLSGLNPLSRKGRMMARRFNADAHDDSLDSAGRVRVPKHLRDYAELKGDCVVVGVSNHLEIWGAEAWQKQADELGATASEIAEQLVEGEGS